MLVIYLNKALYFSISSPHSFAFVFVKLKACSGEDLQLPEVL